MHLKKVLTQLVKVKDLLSLLCLGIEVSKVNVLGFILKACLFLRISLLLDEHVINLVVTHSADVLFKRGKSYMKTHRHGGCHASHAMIRLHLFENLYKS